MSDLRQHLFAALEGLSDKTNPMDIDRAQAIANVSAQIINSAKVELQFLRMVDGADLSRVVNPERTAKFFEEEEDPKINPHAGKGLGTGKFLGGNGNGNGH